MSLGKREIFQIHQLNDIGYSLRRIAREMGLSRPTVKRYLIDPCPEREERLHHSPLLEPYYPAIDRYLEIDNKASAVVICQRLQEKGYHGGLTIIKDYLHKLRGAKKQPEAYIRFESAPGEQCQIDWGSFGTLKYGKDYRKIWCFAMCNVSLYFRVLSHIKTEESLC